MGKTIHDSKIIHGDCLSVLPSFEPDSIDAVVTDPPYGLSKEPDIAEVMRHWLAGDDYNHNSKGFMGKTWDSFVPGPAMWKEVFRVLKPGGHMLVFAGTRTQDIMSIALRFAGFEIRDVIMWIYGSGFPKSLNISKAIDKILGAERQVSGVKPGHEEFVNRKTNGDTVFKNGMNGFDRPWMHDEDKKQMYHMQTEPATEQGKLYNGYGSALKPAYEPIIIARKPIEGTIAENVLKYGTGGMNIDGCRVPVNKQADASQIRTMNRSKKDGESGWGMNTVQGDTPQVVGENGRWPANIIHDGSDEILELFPETQKGSAARFFYCAKASQKDRDEGLDGESKQYSCDGRNKPIDNPFQRNSSVAKNNHPTVKPTELMRYLVRLVTPPNGTVIDPFAGSGTTGKAAILEGFNFIGIEKEREYAEIARKRIDFLCEPFLFSLKQG